MLISAKIIKNPHKRWTCDECEHLIIGPVLRLYGAAHSGEKPYVLRLHPDCIHVDWKKREPKLVVAMEGI